MFEKNLQALEKNNPSLALKLRKTPLNTEKINAYNAQSGDINLSYQNLLLHNDIDPIQEASDLFNKVNQQDSMNSFYIICGLGIGYLFKRAYVSSVGKIILFEPFLDLLRFTLEYVDFSAELADTRICICTEIEEVRSFLNNKYLKNDVLEFCYLPSYLQLSAEIMEDLTKSACLMIKSKLFNQNTIASRSFNWSSSSFNNLYEILNALPTDILTDNIEDRPIIIASAGPSLDENVELLRKNRDNFIIFAINNSLRALIKNDIIPDFCFIAEDFLLDTQLKGIENLDKINYILHPRAQNYVWQLGSKKNYFYLAETDGFSIWINNLLDNKYKLLPSAGSVSMLAFYTAFMVFKSSNIILVGQDLAFIDNKAYAVSTLKENESIVIKDNKLILDIEDKYVKEYLSNIELITTKNSLGEDILTRKDYYSYVSDYEDIIANELPENVTVYNTSLRGAYIKGMTYISLSEIIKRIQPAEINISKIITRINSESINCSNQHFKLVSPKLQLFKNECRDYKQKCESLIKQIKQIQGLIKKKTGSNKLETIFRSFYQDKTKVISFLSSNKAVYIFLQKEFLEYLKDYITPPKNQALTLDQHLSNLMLEKALLLRAIMILEKIDIYINNYYKKLEGL